jgi:hypothetical protein
MNRILQPCRCKIYLQSRLNDKVVVGKGWVNVPGRIFDRLIGNAALTNLRKSAAPWLVQSCVSRAILYVEPVRQEFGLPRIGPVPACFSEQGGSQDEAALRRGKRTEKPS